MYTDFQNSFTDRFLRKLNRLCNCYKVFYITLIVLLHYSKTQQHIINATKYYSHDLLNFCVPYEAHNTTNARMFRIRLDDKLHKVYATNNFSTVRRH